MNKLKFIIVAVMLFAQTATYAIGIDTGLTFGVSQANFKIKGDKSAIQNNMGYGIGASLKLNLALVEIGPELWYTRNSMVIEDTSYFGEETKIKSNSLDVPVLVGLGLFGPLKLEFGPSFSLLSSAKADYGSQDYNLNRVRPEMGYVIGAKVSILSVLTIGARFNGCFDTQEVDFMNSTENLRYNSFLIFVGANF